MQEWLKGTGFGLVIYVIIFSMGSTLGLFHTWVVASIIIIVTASFYIPYQLIQAEFLSYFWGIVSLIVVLFIGFKSHQTHLDQIKVYTEEICGSVANRKLDDVGIVSSMMPIQRSKLYQFDVLGGEQGVQRFRKEVNAPRDGASVCVSYIRPKHSWMYSQNIVLKISSDK